MRIGRIRQWYSYFDILPWDNRHNKQIAEHDKHVFLFNLPFGRIRSKFCMDKI